MCRALEGDGADRNLPILEARPFRGVGGQFLDRHVERNIGPGGRENRADDGKILCTILGETRINGEYWPPEKGARLMIDNHDDSDEIDL